MNWDYNERMTRNIGIVSMEEQKKIQAAKIAVLGVGGVGGPLAMNLVYAGVEKIIIADFDKVELSNLNRQPYTEKDIGSYKIDALCDKLKEINSNLKISKEISITSSNISKILKDVDIVVLSLDGAVGSIIVTREAQKKGIPVVEGWATPLTFTRWFTNDPKCIDYETCYGLNIQHNTISEIENSMEIQLNIKSAMINQLANLPNIKEDYSHESGQFEKMMNGEIGIRSFAPIVWSTSIYMAHDVIFAGILERKQRILAPVIHGFDFIRMKSVYIPAKDVKLMNK